jgi:hypothetical protein
MSPAKTAKTLVRAALIAGTLLLATVRPAAAATPCWKALLNDWYDGRIDNTYALHCYTDALKHLPPDVQTYSSAHDDIERALQSAIAKLGKKKVTSNTQIAPPPATTTTDTPPTDTTPGGTKKHNAHSTQPTGGSGNTPPTTPTSTGRKPGGGISEVANKLDPGSADSLPVPLLVLGGLALILVAGGAGGLLVKNIRARRSGA